MHTHVTAAVQPRRPIGPGWEKLHNTIPTGYPNEGWLHRKRQLMVISAVESADGILTGQPCAQYHVSITGRTRNGQPKRCSLDEARWVIHQFGIPEALEDNHGPLVRSWWRPVADNLAGVDCECKGTEAPITDGDFTWRPLTQSNHDQGSARLERLLEAGRD